MAGKREKPEDIVSKLRQVEVLQGQGATIAEAVRQIGVTQQTFYRWRKLYGGMQRSQLARLKDWRKRTSGYDVGVPPSGSSFRLFQPDWCKNAKNVSTCNAINAAIAQNRKCEVPKRIDPLLRMFCILPGWPLQLPNPFGRFGKVGMDFSMCFDCKGSPPSRAILRMAKAFSRASSNLIS